MSDWADAYDAKQEEDKATTEDSETGTPQKDQEALVAYIVSTDEDRARIASTATDSKTLEMVAADASPHVLDALDENPNWKPEISIEKKKEERAAGRAERMAKVEKSHNKAVAERKAEDDALLEVEDKRIADGGTEQKEPLKNVRAEDNRLRLRELTRERRAAEEAHEKENEDRLEEKKLKAAKRRESRQRSKESNREMLASLRERRRKEGGGEGPTDKYGVLLATDKKTPLNESVAAQQKETKQRHSEAGRRLRAAADKQRHQKTPQSKKVKTDVSQ